MQISYEKIVDLLHSSNQEFEQVFLFEMQFSTPPESRRVKRSCGYFRREATEFSAGGDCLEKCRSLLYFKNGKAFRRDFLNSRLWKAEKSRPNKTRKIKPKVGAI